MAIPITPEALAALAVEALANDTVRYGRDKHAYPDTKGTPYIIAEAFGITSQEAREHSKAFMAAWRAAGGSAQVKRLTEQAKPAAPAGEVAEVVAAPAKATRKRKAKAATTVEIAAPAPAHDEAEAIAFANAFAVAWAARKA